MAQSLKLAIEPGGAIVAIYDDSLAGLIEQGHVDIARVSDVEPYDNGGWLAVMRRDGARLGPFRLRAEALAAEVDYLNARLFS